MARKSNLQKICEDFGCTRQYIGELVKSQIIPKPNSRGSYDHRACVRAYIAHLKKNTGRSVDTEKRNLEIEERQEKVTSLKLKNEKVVKERDDDAKRGEMSLKEIAESMDQIIVG